MKPIQIGQRLHRFALNLLINTWGARQANNRVTHRPKRHTLMGGRQKTRSPKGGTATGPTTARLQHHKCRQVFRFAAYAIAQPTTQARPARLSAACIDKQFRWGMVKNIGGHSAHKSHIVGNILEMRQQLRDLQTGIPNRGKLALGPTQLGTLFRECVHEGESFSLHKRLGNWLIVELLQLGLGLKQLKLAGAARHEQVNHPLGLGRVMKAAQGIACRNARGSCCQTITPQQVRKRYAA